MMMPLLGRRALLQLTPAGPQAASTSATASAVRLMSTVFSVDSVNTSGRDGRSTSEGPGKPASLDMAFPPRPSGHNPEQLLGLGYSACFNGALQLVAAKNGFKIGASTVTVSVSLQNTGEDTAGVAKTRFGLGIKLHADVAGVDDADALRVAQLAHEMCPYSRGFRGNVETELTAKGDR